MDNEDFFHLGVLLVAITAVLLIVFGMIGLGIATRLDQIIELLSN